MTSSFVIFISCVAVAVLINNGVIANECEEIPKEMTTGNENCCRFPNITDPETEKKIGEILKDMAPTSKDNFVKACKIAQIIFTGMNLIKNGGVDKEAYTKLVDAKIPKEEEYWKQPLKDAFDHCQKVLQPELPKITELFSKAPLNIKKEDCDAQYMVTFMCLHFDSIANCPEKAWTSSKTCDASKSWLEKCGKDINAMQKIVAATIKTAN